MDDPNRAGAPGSAPPPAGIVVHDSAPLPPTPRGVAFLWAGADFPAPSLPFGRWKPRAA